MTNFIAGRLQPAAPVVGGWGNDRDVPGWRYYGGGGLQPALRSPSRAFVDMKSRF